MSALLAATIPERRNPFTHMEATSRKVSSPVRSEEDSHNGDNPTTPSKSQFPIFLQSSNILTSGCKMTVSNCLFYAVLKARFQKTRFFLDRGLDVNSRNDFGFNTLVAALHIDDDYKREKMLNLLLRNGADPLRRDLAHGRNSLSWACVLGREKEVEKILDDFGGNVDLADRDNDGLTALHHATHVGNIRIIRLLTETFLKYRLSIDVQDSQGMTPYVHARRLGMREVADVLRTEGFASPSVSDSMFFKSPREWSQIGRFERKRSEQLRRRDEINKAKIEGRVYRPRYDDVQEEESEQDKDYEKRQKKISVQTDILRETNSLPPRKPVTTEQENIHFETRSERGSDYVDGRKRGSGVVALDLIGLSGRDRGHLPSTFHHSELDTSKVSEYPQMFGSINSLMTILSHEQTTSFRKPVMRRAPSVREVTPKNKSKVSTLAILFGKEKGKKGVRKGRDKEKQSNNKRKQTSKRGVLPDIRLNDRSV